MSLCLLYRLPEPATIFISDRNGIIHRGDVIKIERAIDQALVFAHALENRCEQEILTIRQTHRFEADDAPTLYAEGAPAKKLSTFSWMTSQTICSVSGQVKSWNIMTPFGAVIRAQPVPPCICRSTTDMALSMT